MYHLGRVISKREAGNNLVFLDIVASPISMQSPSSSSTPSTLACKLQVLCEKDFYTGSEVAGVTPSEEFYAMTRAIRRGIAHIHESHYCTYTPPQPILILCSFVFITRTRWYNWDSWICWCQWEKRVEHPSPFSLSLGALSSSLTNSTGGFEGCGSEV